MLTPADSTPYPSGPPGKKAVPQVKFEELAPSRTAVIIRSPSYEAPPRTTLQILRLPPSEDFLLHPQQPGGHEERQQTYLYIDPWLF